LGLLLRYLEAVAIIRILLCCSESSSGSSWVGMLSMKKLYLICESAKILSW